MTTIIRAARPALLWLLAVAVLVLMGLLAPGHARAATQRACSSYGHAAVFQTGFSRVWISGSTCAPDYPLFYNQTQCIYIHGVTKWMPAGPQRHGNGSSTSNYSQVSCLPGGATGIPHVVREWFNQGAGWSYHQFSF